jgi:hypothetical protein
MAPCVLIRAGSKLKDGYSILVGTVVEACFVICAGSIKRRVVYFSGHVTVVEATIVGDNAL